MTPFETYQKFLALKMHFTSDYDIIKYNGKVKANYDSFEKRKDKYFFYKLSKMKEPESFILSNMIENDISWIGDLFDPEKEEVYKNWNKRQQSLSYIFSNDIKKLLPSFNENFIIKDGQHPPLLKLYRRKEVCIETLILLDEILNYFPYWNKNIQDTVIWPNIYKRLVKYKPLFHYDKAKIKNILKTYIENT
jgi:hypothetical protein